MDELGDSLKRLRQPEVLRAIVAFGIGVLALLVLYWPSWASMARIWFENETYTHGALVPLVTLWLIWRDRDRIEGLRPTLSRAPAVVLLACSAAWMVGHLAGVNALQHFAVVTMIIALFATVFGVLITWRLSFALLFLLFMVPFGEFLLPWLMDRTADFTVRAVQLSGIPIYREGRNFVLPSGRWSVVEACSGLRYLLAAIPLGLLYAHLNFRSRRTQAIYVACVILIAVVANWLRAYGIVMLGHLSGMTLAVGVDHLIYGWLFFGVVMGLAFWVGSRIQEGPGARAPMPPNAFFSPVPFDGSAAPGLRRILTVTVLTSGAMLAGPAISQGLARLGQARVDLAPLRAELGVHPARIGNYLPVYAGTRDSVVGADASARVGVGIYRFYRQTDGHEMIAHGNGATPVGDGPLAWLVARQSQAGSSALPGSEHGGSVNEYELENSGRRWLVWEWYWVDGRLLSDPRKVKLATALSILSGRGDESLAFVIWTPLDDKIAPARDRIATQAIRLIPAAKRAGL